MKQKGMSVLFRDELQTIDWAELDGHTLEICLNSDQDRRTKVTIIAELDRATGNVYILDETHD